MNKYVLEQRAEARKNKFEKELNKKKTSLLDNDDYFIWLNEFSNKYSIFTDSTDLNIKENDETNVKNLYVLYNLIKQYAYSKGIEVYDFEKNFGIYYNFINMDIPYEIGVAKLNDRLVYFCNRCDYSENKNFINIRDIKNEYLLNKQLKEEYKVKELLKLKKKIIKLLENDIKEKEILLSIEDGINEYKTKQIVKKYIKNTD